MSAAMSTTTKIMLGLFGASAVLLLVAVIASLYIADKFTRLRGTMRAFHLFEKFGYNFSDIPDLTDKYYIVTGANSGLGFGTCKLLAQQNAHVILACRTVSKGEEAKKQMKIGDKGSITVMELDLADLKSVKRFAQAYLAMKRPLHGLILNAGVMVPPYELTKDGLESQFGVNHVAHFALTKELLPLLLAQPDATVVAVSSLAHWFTVPGGVYLDLAKINNQDGYNRQLWYGQSKLCNRLFANELAKRYPSLLANSVHPGAVQGNLNRHLTGDNKVLQLVDKVVQAIFYWPCDMAALTTLRPALAIKEKLTGKYFVPIARVDEGSELGRSEDLAKKVWEFTEEVLKQKGWESM